MITVVLYCISNNLCSMISDRQLLLEVVGRFVSSKILNSGLTQTGTVPRDLVVLVKVYW